MMMNVKETYSAICRTQNGLGYEMGLVEDERQVQDSPFRRQLFLEATQRLGKNEFDAVSFSGDVPIAYFKLLSSYNGETVRRLHQLAWNQNRVPSLYIVTPASLAIYNCFDEPIKPDEEIEKRLVRQINIADEALNQYHEFAKVQIDSGAFWKSEVGRQYRSDRRVDYYLLTQLRETRKILHKAYGLPYKVIHDLLGRSIFILYLEDRGAIREGYYSEQFLQGATSYLHVLKDKSATYALFDALADRFNGDLLPVSEKERQEVSEEHLNIIINLFGGGIVRTGQLAIWRPYDFAVIPIELVSAIYEEFLHKEQGKNRTSNTGTYYTPHPLVEFVMNEVLPWPSPNDHDYNLKLLDPACGSGIFLVEGYRRLIARWMYSHKSQDISPSTLREILIESIFGIDINPEAISVAAFSLYLALLDHLKAKTIWETVRFPDLTYWEVCPSDKEGNSLQSGRNLFPMSTFVQDGPFERSDYDIVVGNPPWKRGNLPKEIAAYCLKNEIGQELAQAFVWRAKELSAKGKMALIVNSKTLFNNSYGDKNFRQKLLTECYLETVVNFSALRKKKGDLGKQLFASAVGPAAVLFYRATPPNKPNREVLYCTPKPTRLDSALPNITIDASEIQFIPRSQLISLDWSWKIAMWGTQRDAELIQRFKKIPTLGECIKQRDDWYLGVGLEVPGGGSKKESALEGLPLVKTSSVRRYWGEPVTFESNRLGNTTYRRIGAKETYIAPHILVKQGQKNKRFCATYFDFDCAFKHAISGISSKDPILLKALVAYLNSSFASYFLFLTTATWGVERERVNFNEILELPGIPFEMPTDETLALAEKVEQIGTLMKQRVPDNAKEIQQIESEIDLMLYDFMNLSKNESILIEDVLSYSLDFFQEGERSEACYPAQEEDLLAYAQIFCKTINSILRFGQTSAWAAIYAGNSPLRVVSICLSQEHPAGTIMTIEGTLDETLHRINDKLIEEYTENVYLRRYIKIYNKYSVDIVKPNEKRFWSRSIALKDADALLAEGVALENEHVEQFA